MGSFIVTAKILKVVTDDNFLWLKIIVNGSILIMIVV